MNENDPEGTKQGSSDVASGFRTLGNNLKNIFQQAWESEERKNLQNEIEIGLSNLGKTLDEAAQEFRESEAGQRLETEAKDFRDRVRSGEVETKMRDDLATILQKVNYELEKILKPKTPQGGGEE
jgi:hypothetical protein